MKPFIICACLLTSPGVTFAQPAAEGLVSVPRGDYRSGYRAGVIEAEKDLSEGVAAFYIYGLLPPREFLDRQTGLPLERIGDCVVNETIRGREAGHNDRIWEYILEEGLPRNSFTRWERELFDLKGYFENRTKTEKPHRLTLGGQAAVSPDGERAIWLIGTKTERRDGKS